MNEKKTIAYSSDYLSHEFQISDGNAHQTLAAVKSGKLGERSIKLSKSLDDNFSLLARLASCWWDCDKSDHLIHNFLRRAYNAGICSLRLTHFSFYDEAIALIRTVGEIVNLLQLFGSDDALIEDWKLGKNKKFRPVDVRLALEKKNILPAVDQILYNALSGSGVHVDYGSLRRTHTSHDHTIVGSQPASIAFLILLNQIGYLISYCTALGASILIKDPSLKKEIIDQSDITVKLCSRNLLVSSYSDWLANGNLGASIAIIKNLSLQLKLKSDQDEFEAKLDDSQINFLRVNNVRLCHAVYWKNKEMLVQYFIDLRVAQIYWSFSEQLVHRLAKDFKSIEGRGLPETNISLQW